MINLHHFRVFYHVAKNRSFTLAGRDLHITQPAVTKQIQALEEEWDLKLFGKKGAKIILTEDGKVLFEYAKKIFDYEKEIELVIREITSLERGTLRIASPKPLNYIMNFLMDVFHKEYPKVRIQVIEGNSLSLLHGLTDKQIEVAFLAKVQENPDVQFVPFSREEISFVVSPNHHLAEETSISIKDLSEEPIILKALGSGTRKFAVDLFKQHKYSMNILLETANTDFIIEVVQRGEAGAFLSAPDITELINLGKLVKVPIATEKIYLDIYVAYLKEHSFSQPARAFLNLMAKLDLKQHFPYLVSTWPDGFSFADVDR